MAQFIKVATIPEFEGLETARLVEVCGRAIAIFKQGGEYYAPRTSAPIGGFLSEGIVEGDEVVCPLHGAQFNLKTGAVTAPPARQGVRTSPVRITGNEVEIE